MIPPQTQNSAMLRYLTSFIHELQPNTRYQGIDWSVAEAPSHKNADFVLLNNRGQITLPNGEVDIWTYVSGPADVFQNEGEKSHPGSVADGEHRIVKMEFAYQGKSLRGALPVDSPVIMYGTSDGDLTDLAATLLGIKDPLATEILEETKRKQFGPTHLARKFKEFDRRIYE